MKTILTPVDFSSATRGVIAVAQDMARSSGGRVVLLHVVQHPVIMTDYGPTAEVLQETNETNQAAACKEFEHLEKSLSEEGVSVTS
jgi:universal stress protein A